MASLSRAWCSLSLALFYVILRETNAQIQPGGCPVPRRFFGGEVKVRFRSNGPFINTRDLMFDDWSVEPFIAIEVSVSCDAGTHLFINSKKITRGKIRLHCKNGEWEQPFPFCVLPDPPVFDKIEVRRSCDCSGLIKLLEGRMVEPSNCPPHRVVEDGETTVLKCLPSFSPYEGQLSTALCEKGVWTRIEANCRSNSCKCSLLTSSLDEAIEEPRCLGDNGETVLLKCRHQHEMEDEPNQRLMCSNGEWEKPVLSCPALCKVPEIVNGILEVFLKGYAPLAQLYVTSHVAVRIRCHDGYTLWEDAFLRSDEPFAFIKCEGGMWDAPVPICLKDEASCETPDQIENGRIEKWNRGYANVTQSHIPSKDRLRVTCERGYEFQPLSSDRHVYLECQNGTWDNQIPSCVKRDSFEVSKLGNPDQLSSSSPNETTTAPTEAERSAAMLSTSHSTDEFTSTSTSTITSGDKRENRVSSTTKPSVSNRNHTKLPRNCWFRESEGIVSTFLKEGAEIFITSDTRQRKRIPSGTTIISRCQDSDGRHYKFVGDETVACFDGRLLGKSSKCLELIPRDPNTAPVITREVNSNGRLRVLPNGTVSVSQGTHITLSCLYFKFKGQPMWYFNGHEISHLSGWNSFGTEYNVRLVDLQETDTGKYTCETPYRRGNSVRIFVHSDF